MPLFTGPLERSARVLHRELGPDCDVVLLGSIASPKYVDILLTVFGDRLLFPVDFVGRGDMSRGGLLLRKAAEGRSWNTSRCSAPSGTASAPPGSRSFRTPNDDPRYGADRHRMGRRQALEMKRSVTIPSDRNDVVLSVDGREVRLTNLRKVFWSELELRRCAGRR